MLLPHLPNPLDASPPRYISSRTPSQLPALRAPPSSVHSAVEASSQIPLPPSSPAAPGSADISSLGEGKDHTTASTSIYSVCGISSPTTASHATLTQVPISPPILYDLPPSRHAVQSSQSMQSSPLAAGAPASSLLLVSHQNHMPPHFIILIYCFILVALRTIQLALPISKKVTSERREAQF